MQNKSKKILLVIILIGAALIPVLAFKFSDFSKSISLTNSFLTGKVIQDSSYYCGEYALVTPSSAQASSMLGSGFSAEKAIDNNTETRWVGNSSLPYPKWISFDLGEKKCIRGLEIYFATFDVPIKMNIEFSNDGSSWETAVLNWTVYEGGAYKSPSFEEKRARFVRLSLIESAPNMPGAVAEFKANSAPLIFNDSVIEKKCYDSDGGKNYKEKGFVNITNQTSSSQIYEDGCFSEKGLFEYFCQDSNAVLETVVCEGICSQGACSSVNISKENESPSQSEESFGETTQESSAELKLNCGSYSLITPKAALANSLFNNFRASNAIDGDPETHWFGDPEKGYPKWITFDLGSKKCVNGLELEFFIWDVPITFDIQTSLDNKHWTNVQSNLVVSDGGKKIRKDFAETYARFIRIYEREGKRTYGTLSEIQVNAAPYGEAAKIGVAEIKIENVIGSPTADKFYEINGQRAFVEIDGKPVEQYF